MPSTRLQSITSHWQYCTVRQLLRWTQLHKLPYPLCSLEVAARTSENRHRSASWATWIQSRTSNLCLNGCYLFTLPYLTLPYLSNLPTNPTPWSRILLQKLKQCLAQSTNSPYYKEPKRSVHSSRQPITCPILSQMIAFNANLYYFLWSMSMYPIHCVFQMASFLQVPPPKLCMHIYCPHTYVPHILVNSNSVSESPYNIRSVTNH
jgi:hypothetical protein